MGCDAGNLRESVLYELPMQLVVCLKYEKSVDYRYNRTGWLVFS